MNIEGAQPCLRGHLDLELSLVPAAARSASGFRLNVRFGPGYLVALIIVQKT